MRSVNPDHPFPGASCPPQRRSHTHTHTQSNKGNSPFPQVVPDDRLVEPLAFVKELSDVLWGVLEEVVLLQELDPLIKKRTGSQLNPRLKPQINHKLACKHLFRVHVELLPPHGDLLISLRGFAADRGSA